MERLLRVYLTAIAATVFAGPGMACEDGRGIQIGVDWINNTCAKGEIVECYDVADSVVRSMAQDPPCPGFNPGLIKQHVKNVRALMTKLSRQDPRLPKLIAARRAGRLIEDQSRGRRQNGPVLVTPPPQELPPIGCYDGGGVWVCPDQ